ncbi:insulinase family protein [Spongiibacter sp. KMU-158]|uniref:Insulinase family protein n=1 Tax=Spongiibacter pelagi TaxID=2760804 RepID=A0A927GWJ4_9GAMM|nr:insulinase family protein [Spongiibacter pelagi]MBD2858484.1 insulinase family protein [Spongiibacter pelagi]
MNQALSSDCFDSFEPVNRETITALGIDISEYRHRKTGASHYHISSDNPENVFMVALRTVPEDSTGVAHILEHTALCGSEKFPVRDPFFMMIRRSLNSFMNAMTSSDWTAYPFASSNRKDFDNLLQVYMDAVFFSRLHPLDFAQEGHRLEFAEADNPNSELVYKGVVFNEMKGAMSSINSRLWHTLCKYLFPSVTYHYNSGGDPEAIPDLSYEQLQEFYRTHYHPSNAIFMTFGDIPAAEHQARFEELALSRFELLEEHIAVPNEKRYHAPIRAEEAYPLPAEEDPANKTHIVMAWLMGKSTDLESQLEAQLLAGVLLDNSASPLLHALETTQLGTAPSPLCGLEDSMREMVLACGIEGGNTDSVEAVETLILDTLKKVAKDGVPQSDVEAVLHQLELQQREIGGDGYPYGLQLIMHAIGSATHRGNPADVLNLDPALETLHQKIQNPDYIPNLAKALLDNPHRVTLILRPDQQYQQRMEQAEKQRLSELKTELDDAQVEAILAQTKALQERQNLKEDESILPKIGLDDVPADIPVLEFDQTQFGELPVTRYAQGTNGLVYQQVLFQLPSLNDAEIELLPFYCRLLTELGLGEQNYLQVQSRQAQVCGGISAYSSMRGAINNEQELGAYLVLSSKALLRNASEQAQLMRKTLEQIRFTETERIVDVIKQISARRQSSITGNGHGLAMTAASAGMSPLARISQKNAGLEGIASLKQRVTTLENSDSVNELSTQLNALHEKLMKGSRSLLLVADAEHMTALSAELESLWQGFEGAETAGFESPELRETRRQFWVANTQVNFCAAAYPTVPSAHPDAPVLTVLSGYLRNGYLHRTIREQGGAYGGGASQDSNIAAFRFYSYRDPRLQDTLSDFSASIDWMLKTPVDEEALEQAILGVVSSIDKPGSPAGEAKQDFHNRLFGRNPEQRKQFRQRVLETTAEDLLRVTRNYLEGVTPSIAIVSNDAQASALKDWISAEGLEIKKV